MFVSLYQKYHINFTKKGWFIFCTVSFCLIVKDNRINIRVEFTRKKCKTPILFYCFHTAGELHTFVLALYNLLGSETSFNRKNFHQNYLFFSKSLFRQPVMHFRVHFIISFTLHSWVPFSVKEFFNGYVNRSYCIIVMYCV